MFAASAFADTTPDQLADQVIAAFDELGPPAHHTDTADEDSARIYSSGRWSIIVWPDAFHLYDVAACQAITNHSAGRASSVHIYDDDYWTHAAISAGQLNDYYSSNPTYFTDDPRLTIEYAGTPAIVAALLNITPATAAQYLKPVNQTTGHPVQVGDQFTDCDPWVFTDLWAAADITYPDNLDHPDVIIDLGPDWESVMPDNPTQA